jgi:hypothetical protein
MWIPLTELEKESELLNSSQNVMPTTFWNTSESVPAPF